MAMSDPIADMLTRIRNASRARHPKVSVPWSRVKERIARVLVEEGFVKDVKKVKAPGSAWDELVIQLKFDRENRPIILGMRRISKPSRRVYTGAKELTPVRRGLGIQILSTSKGIMVDREAQKANIGGEVICSVW